MSVPQLPETLQRTWALAGVTYLAVNSSDTGPLGCVSPRAFPDRAPRRGRGGDRPITDSDDPGG